MLIRSTNRRPSYFEYVDAFILYMIVLLQESQLRKEKMTVHMNIKVVQF